MVCFTTYLKKNQSCEICEELVHLSSVGEVITRAPGRAPADWLMGAKCVSYWSAVFNFEVALATTVNLAAILFFSPYPDRP